MRPEGSIPPIAPITLMAPTPPTPPTPPMAPIAPIAQTPPTALIALIAPISNPSPLISNYPPFSNIHVGNLKSPRGYFLFSTWASFISSEVSFDSSEEFFLPHVENKNSPRGYFEISTWKSVFANSAETNGRECLYEKSSAGCPTELSLIIVCRSRSDE